MANLFYPNGSAIINIDDEPQLEGSFLVAVKKEGLPAKLDGSLLASLIFSSATMCRAAQLQYYGNGTAGHVIEIGEPIFPFFCICTSPYASRVFWVILPNGVLAKLNGQTGVCEVAASAQIEFAQGEITLNLIDEINGYVPPTGLPVDISIFGL
jgi:hypothetical protein